MARSFWERWHAQYDEPGSAMQPRLRRVQERVAEALSAMPAGTIRVLSMCAGQCRELIEPLAVHPRRHDVLAVLVELDPVLVDQMRQACRRHGLSGVRPVRGDAGTMSAYREIAPVDLALVCGVFSSVGEDDVRRTIEALPFLVRRGGVVIWTRHRRAPDLTTTIRRWLTASGFVEVGFDTGPEHLYAVGTHRLERVGLHPPTSERLFTFPLPDPVAEL